MIRIIIFSMILFVNAEYVFSVDTYCGPRSLLLICKHYNINTTMVELCILSKHDNLFGTTMLGLYQAAIEKKLYVAPVKYDLNKIKSIKEPFIAYVDGNHFIVVRSINKNTVKYSEYPREDNSVNKKIFYKRWKGEALIFGKEAKAFNRKFHNNDFLIFDRNSIYLGVLEEGQAVKCNFKCKNISNQVINISLRSSCGCTKPKMSTNTIKPGREEEIIVNYNAIGSGLIKQTIHVKTNNNINVELNISAIIKSGLQIYPEIINCGNIYENKKYNKYIYIIPKNNNENIEPKVETMNDITTEIMPRIKYKNEISAIPIKVIIEISSEKYQENVFEKQIKIKIDKYKINKTIRIFGTIKSDYNIYPNNIFIDNIFTNTEKSFSSIVYVNSKILPKIYIKNNNKNISTEVQRIENSKYKLVTRIRSIKYSTVIKDTLNVYINGKCTKLPIYARVVQK